MKSYTDLKQSKKLKKILSENNDLWYNYYRDDWNKVKSSGDIPSFKMASLDDIPCWSQAALYNILPVTIGNLLEKNALRLRMDKGETNFNVWYEDLDNGCCVEDGLDVIESNPVDAYYKMIIKLHERELI